MTKDIVSYQDLYKAIDDFRKENTEQFKEVKMMFANFKKDEFEPVKAEMEKLKGFRAQAFAIAGLVGVGINLLKDWVMGGNQK